MRMKLNKGILLALSLLLYFILCSLPLSKYIFQYAKVETVNKGLVSIWALELRCGCDRRDYFVGDDPTSSICSARATSRGRGQHVVSFSLFGSKSNGGRAPHVYENILPELFQNIRVQYPGWVVRIYTNYKPEIPDQKNWMCEIQCNHSQVDFCFVDRLPQLGDIGRVQDQGMTWRFLPGLDSLVDVFISRDTDSMVSDRERAAVKEWLGSNSMVHVMRDHPYHNYYILGGMWGAKTFMNRSLMVYLTMKMMLKKDLKRGYGFDQEVLRMVFWPVTTHLMLVHDSYFCAKPEFQGPEYRPFPTRRDGQYFVSYGPRFQVSLEDMKECPLQCRPRKHQDWVYC